MIGRTVSHYQIVEQLGGGGMGVVYKAKDTQLKRFVALKFLPPEWSRDPEFKQRFRQEAEAASALEHNNICTIHEISETEDGQLFIVMAAYEGETLQSKIERGPLSAAEAIDMATQAANGLSKAHEAGFVHRDIKPANLFVTEDGGIKILDFGLAKLAGRTNLTKAGSTVGTVAYMSPEQARGEEVDSRSDVWSLGVVLFEMLTGQKPFPGESEQVAIYSILNRDPVPVSGLAPGLPETLVATLDRSLAKPRDQRTPSAKAFAEDLRGLREDHEAATAFRPAAEAPTELRPAAGAVHSRKPFWIGVGALVVVAATAMWWWRPTEPVAEATLTDTDVVLLTEFVNTTGDPVFDSTLRQALAIKLEESPFLKLASDQETSETMAFMGLGDEDAVTLERGLEICQRQSNRAIVSGEIAPLGSSYVVTVSAVGCVDGAVLARHQVQATSQEGVLPALGEVSSEVRKSLGESLASVRAFDVPIEQATTSSLEALRAYSVGIRMRVLGLEEDSLRHFRQAIELDPEFPMAHATLGVVSSNLGLAHEYAERMHIAYELRDRVTQAEHSYIVAHYHQAVTGDFGKIIETYEMWRDLYPRALVPVNNLAAHYNWTGEIDKAVAPAERALELGADQAWPHRELVQAYIQVGRLDEARQVLDDAIAKGFELFELHRLAYYLAFLEGDAEGMQAVGGEQSEFPLWLLAEEANVAASAGKLARATGLLREVADGLLEMGFGEAAAVPLALAAQYQVLFGDRDSAETLVTEARNLAPTAVLYDIAVTLGWAGADRQALRLIEQMDVDGPPGTQTREREMPIVAAVVSFSQGDSRGTLESLEPVPQVERRFLIAFYLRGMAQLEEEDGAAATAEFDRIREIPGVRPTHPLHTLAHLGLARAHALSGDLEASRAAYEEFFTLVEEADAGLPLIEAARAEHSDLDH